MAAARFNVQRKGKQLSKKEFRNESIPAFLQTTTWEVYSEYWIEDCPAGFQRRYANENGGEPYWECDGYELMLYSLDYSLITAIPPGRFIRHKYDIVKKYNPLTDTPDIFLIFASLGKKEAMNEVAIIQFTKKYGLLKLGEPYIPLENTWSYHQGYPLMAFHLYAREAYGVLTLYSALNAKNIDKIRISLDQLATIQTQQGFDYEIMDDLVFELSTRWINILPTNLRISIHHLLDDEKTNIEDYDEYYKSHIKEIWDTALAIMPSEVLFDFGGKTIAAATQKRMGFIKPDIEFSRIQKKNRNQSIFVPSWSCQSLLSAMWLLFYLKITNQLEQTYQLCLECNEPIIAPRKNQIYHENCRKAVHIRNRRLVERLWKEGNSIEEIISHTGIIEVRVKSWIEKIDKK